MSLEVVRDALSNNPTALQSFGEFEGTLNTNIARIAELEKSATKHGSVVEELKSDRDRIKSIMRRELDITEFSEEAVRNKVRSFGESDALLALEKQLSESKDSAYRAKNGYEEQIAQLQQDSMNKDLKSTISKTGVYGDLSSDLFAGMLDEWVLDGASLDENGEIMYTDKDGATLRNNGGAVLSLEDRIEQVRNDPKRSKIFIEARGAGGGQPTSGRPPSASGLIRSKMSFDQKKAYRAEFGDTNYGNLPLA